MTNALSGLKVLVVEDNHFMRTILVTLLRGAGVVEVHEAADGAEAFDLLRQHPADVVIVDIRMDVIDGIEFTKLIRTAADSPNRYVPVICVSAFTDRKTIEEARDAGINEFLAKPISAKGLISRLQSVLNKPRSFIRTATYFGPDRRRRQLKTFRGPYRRAEDAEKGLTTAASQPKDG